MIRYDVIKNGAVTYSWTSDQFGPDHYGPGFGLPERDELDNEGKPTGVRLPAEYEIVETDITAELAAQAAVEKGLRAQTLGAQCIAKVYAINEAKFAAGTLSTQDFQAILADPTLQLIERLLWNGSLVTARQMIQAYNSPFFTAEDIAAIVAVITVT